MFLFSLIILCIFAIAFCFLFLTWMPTILFWLLLLLIVLFLFTHIIPILIIIAIIWGISYYRRRQRTDRVDQAFQQATAGPRDVNEDSQKTASHAPNKVHSRSLERVQADFEEKKALNLGDGLWIDQAGQELLLVTDGEQKSGYLRASFSDISTYFTKFESDYSQTFAIHFDGMAEQDFANVTLSKQENELLGQSPAAYLASLLSRYGVPLKKN